MNRQTITAYIAAAALLIMATQSCKRSGDGIDDYSWMEDTTALGADTIPRKDVINILEMPGTAMRQQGGQQHVKFYASAPWSIGISPEASQWLSVIPSKGGEGTSVATITFKENATNYERNAAITIAAGNAAKTITVQQKQMDAILVSAKKVEVEAEGEIISLDVKANIQYMQEIESSAESWIAQDLSKQFSTQTYKYVIKPNPSSKARQGDIKFFGNSQTETVTVYQYGKIESVVVSNSHYTVPQEGGDIMVEIRSNSEFSASVPSETWLKLNTEKTQSDFTRCYTASPNKTTKERTCFIEYVSRDRRVRDTVFVTQEMYTEKMEVTSEKEFALENPGGEITISVDANTGITFEMPEWITGPKSGKEGASDYVFAVSQNFSYDSRDGIIKVQNASGTISDEIKVSQTQTIDGLTIASHPEGSLPKEAGTYLVSLKSIGRWVAQVSEGARTWILLENATGEKDDMYFTINTTANNTYYEREGSITVKSGKIVKTFSITQLGIDPVLEVSGQDEGVSVPYTGGEVTVTVFSNLDYRVEFPSWVSCSNPSGASGTNKHVFVIGENESAQELSSRIKFTTLDGRKTASVPVTQSKASAIFYIQNVNKTVLETSGGDALIQFITNSPWTAKVSSSAAKWMFLNPKNGGPAGDRDLVVTASRNDLFEDRQGTVTITAGPITKEFTFTQPGAVPSILIAGDTEISAGYEGITASVTVNANIDYTISMPGWISGPAKGFKGTSTLKFTIDRNSSYEKRQGKITFENSEYSVTETIEARQQEKVDEVKAFVSSLSFPSKESFLAFDLNASDTWTAEKTADWITVKPMQGNSGKTYVEVYASSHSGVDERSAKITFTCGKATATVPVAQAPVSAFINVASPAEITATYASQDIEVEVESNTAFMISLPEWISGPQEGPAGKSTLKFTLQQNTGNSMRTDPILLYSNKYNANSKVTVHQDLRQDVIKIIDAPEVIVPASGGKVSITFSATNSWTISHPDCATPSPGSGDEGQHTIELAIGPNTSQYARNVEATIHCGNARPVKIELSQARDKQTQ